MNLTYYFSEREREKLALTSIFGFPITFSWIISPFGLKLWLHISMSGSIIGILMRVPSGSSFPYNRKARDDTADIAHPRDDVSTSWPPKGWSSGFRFSSACFTSFSNSRRKRHLLFTWCEETINIFKCTHSRESKCDRHSCRALWRFLLVYQDNFRDIFSPLHSYGWLPLFPTVKLFFCNTWTHVQGHRDTTQ